MPNGEGVAIQPDGSKYTGQFVNDKSHGFGKYVTGDGKIIYEGNF